MTPQYETLLKQLFVTWDITNGIVTKDFGFVRCSALIKWLEIKPLVRPSSILGRPRWNQEEFRSLFPFWLAHRQGNGLSEAERRDAIPFKVGDITLLCPGPIGVYIIDGDKHGAVCVSERFETIR